MATITYNKLWKLLIDHNMNKTQLKNAANVSSNVIAILGRDEPISVDSLVKIARTLSVDIGDIVEIRHK